VRLNRGIVEVEDGLRRIGRDTGGKFIGGDIVVVNKTKYVVVEEDGVLELEELAKDGKKKKVPFTEDAKLVLRSGRDEAVEESHANGMRIRLDVRVESFRGLRVLPGDVIETKLGTHVVAGKLQGFVWVKQEDGTVFALPGQSLLSVHAVRIVEMVDDVF
jgi:hypothetical protein